LRANDDGGQSGGLMDFRRTARWLLVLPGLPLRLAKEAHLDEGCPAHCRGCAQAGASVVQSMCAGCVFHLGYVPLSVAVDRRMEASGHDRCECKCLRFIFL